MSLIKEFTQLNEVKLSRVFSHFKSDRPVGIITAFRGEYPVEENTKRNQQLASKLRSEGFGYVWVDGAWIENKGTDDEETVSEVSLMIIGQKGEGDKLFNFLQQAAQTYDQEAFVFKGEDQHIGVYSGSGEKEMEFSEIRMDQVADVYSRLRSGSQEGRSFFFEGERTADGWASKLLRSGSE